MSGDRFKIFLSSGLTEFKPERKLIATTLRNSFDLFTYEDDAGARSQSIQDTYYDEIDRSELYIAIFGTGYGQYTIDEFERARTRGIPCFIYERELKPDDTRDAKLTAFLKSISGVKDKDGLSTCWFKNKKELIRFLQRDLGRWVKSRSYNPPVEKLSQNKRFYCNRDMQFMDFLEAQFKENSFNFFLLDGEIKQSHTSLVKRFGFDYSGNVKSTISLKDMGSVNRLKLYIQKELFTKFDIRPLPVVPQDFAVKNLIKNIEHDGYERVFVIFRVEEDLLGNPNIQEALNWFAAAYCDPSNMPLGAPKFHFFMNVRYASAATSKKKSVRKQLKKYDQFTKLKQLENVTAADIGKWLEDHSLTHNESAKEAVLAKYFTDKDYAMELAEIKLSELISKYNNNDQELFALMQKY